MALINTDWSKELEQVNQSLSKLLDEKVEPMVEKALDRGLAQASAEIQEAIKLLSEEADRQRVLLVNDIKKLLVLSFVGVLILITLFGVYSHFVGY